MLLAFALVLLGCTDSGEEALTICEYCGEEHLHKNIEAHKLHCSKNPEVKAAKKASDVSLSILGRLIDKFIRPRLEEEEKEKHEGKAPPKQK